LRVGLGRKATGSYYTPHSFVRFLVQETLGPLVSERCPKDNPRPAEILKLKVLDPAMGSGHFLVEACRFLGARLYEAARLCDERLAQYEKTAAAAQNQEIKDQAGAQVTEYRARLNAFLPPDAELLAYLPSRAPEAAESGLSQKRAEAICRRLVAIHCLYGVDKNPLAVELAKVSLWIESHSEGLPLTFLDHRLVLGDSLTGPFTHHLLTYPGSKRPIEDLYTQRLPEKLTAALTEAIGLVRDIESTLGATIGDVEVKQTMRQRLEAALVPFKVVAAAWAGGVMLDSAGDDDAYRWLLSKVAESGKLPDDLSSQPRLPEMIARGLGRESVPVHPSEIVALIDTEQVVVAFSYDLAFPEVFFPSGSVITRSGFDAVLGNPPWDKVLPADKEFFASYNFAVLDAATKRERARLQSELLQTDSVRSAYENYVAQFRDLENARDAMYQFQTVEVEGERTIGKQDAFRLFIERNAQLLARTGYTGVVVPSGFHANEGATGVRRLYLEHLGLLTCFSFENRKLLFEIHRSFKFALLVARGRGPTTKIACAFYLLEDQWLFQREQRENEQELSYTLPFIRETGGAYLSFIELRSTRDVNVTEVLFQQNTRFHEFCQHRGILLGRDLNVTDDAWRFVPSNTKIGTDDGRDPGVAAALHSAGYLVLHEGKTFHQYTDHWEYPPRYLIPTANLTDKPDLIKLAEYYRLSYRQIAASTNERTGIFTILPPGIVFTNKAPADQDPSGRMLANALKLIAIANAFAFDFALRLFVSSSTVNYFFLQRIPIPDCNEAERFLTHSALRLCCNHSGFSSLWSEQLGKHWREASVPFTWPVLQNEDERWHVRAEIDALVADAYGLNRDQYRHVLASFSHKSHRDAPSLCIRKFDELKVIGLQEFVNKYDPYWDIPLNENLAQSVIDIPVPAIEPEPQGMLALDHGETSSAPAQPRRHARASRDNGTDFPEYDRVRQLLFERGRLGSSDVQNALGFNATHTRTLLQRLVDDGFAVVEGRGRATRYVARREAAHGHSAE
jgi:hypothetical protein